MEPLIFAGSELSYPFVLPSSRPHGSKPWTTLITGCNIPDSPPWGELLIPLLSVIVFDLIRFLT